MLADGRVLVTGGQSLDENDNFIFRADAELYDPATDSWTTLASRMERARATHFSALTPAGNVVIIGGSFGSPSATLFKTADAQFSPQLGSPFFEHRFGAATILPDGRPFVAGGLEVRGLTLWDAKFGFLGGLNLLPSDRTFATATAFPDGRVLVVGGMDLNAAPAIIHTSIDVFFPIGSTGRFFRATGLDLPRPHDPSRSGDRPRRRGLDHRRPDHDWRLATPVTVIHPG